MPLSRLCIALLAASPLAAGQGLDLPYGSSHPSEVFDWYAPAGSGGPHPAVVFIHGGPSDKQEGQPMPGNLSDLFLRNGISVLAINHHPYPEFAYPVQLLDAAHALQHFREHAPALDLDPGRIAIWGVSSGAIMGGWLAYGPDLAQPGGSSQEQQSTRPQALINVSGLTNFLLMVPAFPSVFLGGGTLGELDPAFLESVSASELVLDVPRAFTPPVVSLYGLNENPPPLNDPHDATLMKDLHAKLQAFPEVWSQSLMLQKSAALAGTSSYKIAAWLLQRFDVPHELDLGFALAGSAGAAPTLEVTGHWAPGGDVSLAFHTSTGQAAGTWLVVGPTPVHLDFKGGLLVPAPALILPLQPAADGALTLRATLPPVVVPGSEFYLQCWQLDPGGPQGFAASNAVLATSAP